MSCANPLSELLVAFAAGELDAGASGRVLEHVESCDACSRELDFLADLTAAAAQPRAAEVPRRGKLLHWKRWLAAAAAVLVVALAVRTLDREPRWSELADRSVPPFVSVELRAPAVSTALELAAAMEGWQQREFARVDAALTEFIAAHPEHAPARFWRGIARRELGRLDDAQADLHSAVELSQGYLREHALWTLANLHLMRAQVAEADAVLDQLAELDGELAANARELQARMHAAR